MLTHLLNKSGGQENPAFRTVQAIIVIVLYFTVDLLGDAIASSAGSGVSTVAPSTGLAFAIIWAWGYWTAPLLFLADCGTTLFPVFPTASGVASSIGGVLGPALGVWALRSINGRRPFYDDPRGMIFFLFVGAGVGGLFAATGGLITLYRNGMVFGGISVSAKWWAYFVSNAIGVLVVAPLALAWRERSDSLRRPVQRIEAAAIVCGTLVAGWLVFLRAHEPFLNQHPLSLALMPFLVWAAIRLNVWTLSLVIFLCAAISVTGTAIGYGPFGELVPNEAMQPLQTFVGIMAATTLILHSVVRQWRRAEMALRDSRAALREANVVLEQRVRERTASLADANSLLRRQIEERRQAEQAARKSERQFRALFESSPDAIFVESPEGVILDANPAACRLHGVGRDLLVGTNVLDGIPEDRREAARESFQKFATGEWTELESATLADDMREVPIEIRGRAITYKGEPAVLLHVRDITERKKAEAQIRELNTTLEKRVIERTRELAAAYEKLEAANAELRQLDRMKSAFIAVTSHEVRTPMTAIIGMLNILERRLPPGDNQLRRYLASAMSGAERLRRTVDRSLEIIRSGHFDRRFNAAPTDVEKLARQVADEVRPFVEIRKQSLQIDIPEELEPVHIDADKIRDVLTNLLMNAVKFTPDSGEIRVLITPGEDDTVDLAVSDTGVGIAEADMPHIFEEFFTSLNIVHHSSGEYEFQKRGIGMGLAIARRFVEMHGGRLWAESEPGKGSRFHLSLPAHPPVPQE